jgi:hypothetical protein
LQGKEIVQYYNVNSNELKIEREGNPTGVYLIKVRTEEGIGTKKVVFN